MVVDARSDQYSLACVLYEMLAGVPPFTGPSHQTVIAKSITAPRPHVGRVRAGVSSELDQVVLRAMSLDPADRYPDMEPLRLGAPGARGRRAVHGTPGTVLVPGSLARAAGGRGWLASARRATEWRQRRRCLPCSRSTPRAPAWSSSVRG